MEPPTYGRVGSRPPSNTMIHGNTPGPDATRHTATIVELTALTPTVTSFRLAIDPPSMRFLPGQWIDLHVTSPTVGAPTVGGFTIVSTPQEAERGMIELAIKRLGGGRAAAELRDHAAIGDRFEVVGPGGAFFLPPDPGPSVFLIAGGIGVNPLMSMVRHLHQTTDPVRVTLVYSATTPSELVFREELERTAEQDPRLTNVFTITGTDREPWEGRRGRIGQQLLQDLDRPQGTTYYLCGPPGMPTDLARALIGLGVPIDAIRFEEW